jgi:hypothetical protein
MFPKYNNNIIRKIKFTNKEKTNIKNAILKLWIKPSVCARP